VTFNDEFLMTSAALCGSGLAPKSMLHELGSWGSVKPEELFRRISALQIEAGAPLKIYVATGQREGAKRGRQVRLKFSRETHIDSLPLRGQVRATLRALAIWYLGDFSAISESELLREKGIGQSRLATIRDCMKSVGLDFQGGEPPPSLGASAGVLKN
jgi:DNA-directed RNA polymerase alpha subunit